jgi:hypothetical protein
MSANKNQCMTEFEYITRTKSFPSSPKNLIFRWKTSTKSTSVKSLPMLTSQRNTIIQSGPLVTPLRARVTNEATTLTSFASATSIGWRLRRREAEEQFASKTISRGRLSLESSKVSSLVPSKLKQFCCVCVFHLN